MVTMSDVVSKSLKGLGKFKENLGQFRDALVNYTTGAGTMRSKFAYNQYVDDDLLTTQELESLFHFNDLAAVIVSKVVEDSLRTGYSFKRSDSKPEDDYEQSEQIKKYLEELFYDKGEQDRFSRAAIFGRLKGGAGLILGVSGAGSLAAPLVDEMVTSLDWVRVADRDQLSVTKYDAIDGTPISYAWTRTATGPVNMPVVEVHASRIIMFQGAVTTDRMRQRNQGWDLSVLQRVKNALTSYDAMWTSTDAMFADASQAVFKLQGLIQALAESSGSGNQDVSVRLQLMDMMRSTHKAIVLDAGDDTGNGAESFEVVDRKSLGGLDGVMQQYAVRLATAARMPLTVLLGMSPAGMDATGQADMNLWYATVGYYETTVLTSRINRLARLVARTLGLQDPESWSVVWPELQKPSPTDMATLDKMRVDAAIALIAAQVALPEEVAMSLRQIAPGLMLTMDLEPRRVAMAQGLEELEAREWNEELEEAPTANPPATTSARKTKAPGTAQTKGQVK